MISPVSQPDSSEARNTAIGAMFLASDESGWLTGEIILASGGQR